MCMYLSCLSRCIYVQGLSMNIIIKLNGIWWWFESSVSPPLPPQNVQRWREFGQKWGDDTLLIATGQSCKSFPLSWSKSFRPPLQKRQGKGRRRYPIDSCRPFNPTTSAFSSRHLYHSIWCIFASFAAKYVSWFVSDFYRSALTDVLPGEQIEVPQ